MQVKPTPSLGEYKGLTVPKRSLQVTEEQVETQLGLVQERFATLKPADDRPVQADDFVVVDITGSSEGKPIEGAAATDYMVQVGSGQFIPGFEENLIGLGVGEHKEFDVVFPADYQVEELREKPASFAVDVKEIKEKITPVLSDEFAKDVSEFETLDELKADVRGRLEKMQTAAVEREFRSRAVDEAVANATLTVPPAMVEREAHALYHDLEANVGEQGLTMDVYLKAMEKTAEEIEEELKPRAEMNVRRRLVLDAVREAEGIEVTRRRGARAHQGRRCASGSRSGPARHRRVRFRQARHRPRRTADGQDRRFVVEQAVVTEMPADEKKATALMLRRPSTRGR